MLPKFASLVAGGVALLMLQGCAGIPAEDTVTQAESVPELNLNLPPAEVDCPAAPERDVTFLERGYDALVAGDYIEAAQYFQRYQRLEKTPQAYWEAGIAIAYVSILPRSPFYDPEAARDSYRELRNQPADVHTQALMMRDALETFVGQQRHIDDLENNNAILREDLEKRQEALKRLRELTLGQREAQP